MDEWMLLQTSHLNAFGFRVYRMQGTCSIGRNQRIAEIKERIQETGDLVRRPTGGGTCLLYTSPSPRDGLLSRMPSSA